MSNDQQLLQEAYQQVLEGKYLDSYGRYKGKSKGKPLGDFDDTAREELRNDERNAGLETDVDIPSEPEKTPISSTTSSEKPASAPTVDFDLSSLANKKVIPVMWDYPDVVIEVDGKPVGPMFSREEGDELVKQLKAGNVEHKLVQTFLRGAQQMGHLNKL
jgi:hypothetical protein